LICAIAVGREGSECAIFLYGLFIEAMQKSQLTSFAGMSVVGLALGVITWYGFQKGFQSFSQKAYFTVSSILLFLTAGGLLLSITRKLIELDWMPFGQQTAWDSSRLLSEQSWIGKILAIVAGYHTHPAVASLVAYVAYWVVSLWLFHRAGRAATQVGAERTSF
jgi:high-affinity iron transporter